VKVTKFSVIAIAGAALGAVWPVGAALADTASDNAAAASALTAMGGMSFLFICCYALLFLITIGLAVFNLIMWYDAAMRDKSDYPDDNKSMWIILLILLNFWAALFYYFMVKRKAGNKA
jgi:hypothetical protein